MRKELQACIDKCEPKGEEMDEDGVVFGLDCTKSCMESFNVAGAYRLSCFSVLTLALILLLGKLLGRLPIPWLGVLAILF